MRTGTRCTTLTKLPVALSGGSRLKRGAGRRREALDRARELAAAEGIDLDRDALADAHVLELRLLEVRRDPHVGRAGSSAING